MNLYIIIYGIHNHKKDLKNNIYTYIKHFFIMCFQNVYTLTKYYNIKQMINR